MKPLLLVLTATLLTGCADIGHLYPVQGPLASKQPIPIYSLTMTGIGSMGALGTAASGTLSVTLPSGEVYKGAWQAVPPDDTSANQMSAEWDGVYGPGFFVASVLGKNQFGRGALQGPRGTLLSIEFIVGAPADIQSVKGVAKDNQGDVFKLTLQGVAGPPPPGSAGKPKEEMTS